MVDLRTGKFTEDVDAEEYDQRKAAKDPASPSRCQCRMIWPRFPGVKTSHWYTWWRIGG